MGKGLIVLCLSRSRYRTALSYQIGESKQRLVIDASVLNHFVEYQQEDSRSLEAGGQLFATLMEEEVNIAAVTGPRDADRRSRYSYVPNRREEQKEIYAMHAKGLHFVGDWHTHPESTPTPSPSDIRTINEAVAKSRHHLHGFIMVVVGSGRFPEALNVSLNTAESHLRLVPERA